jgi:hypothetical protein
MSCKAVGDIPGGILDVAVSVSYTIWTAYTNYSIYKHWEGL